MPSLSPGSTLALLIERRIDLRNTVVTFNKFYRWAKVNVSRFLSEHASPSNVDTRNSRALSIAFLQDTCLVLEAAILPGHCLPKCSRPQHRLLPELCSPHGDLLSPTTSHLPHHKAAVDYNPQTHFELLRNHKLQCSLSASL